MAGIIQLKVFTIVITTKTESESNRGRKLGFALLQFTENHSNSICFNGLGQTVTQSPVSSSIQIILCIYVSINTNCTNNNKSVNWILPPLLRFDG